MLSPIEIVFALIHYRLRWIVPMLVVTLAAVTFAFVKPSSWEATQGIVLRDEAISSLGRPGEFAQVEDMKHAQETVLQLARSRDVIATALLELGPPEQTWPKFNWFASDESTSAWPNKDDITTARDSITVHSPSGTEFGTTEILYITVEADTPERADKLNHLICDQLDKQLEAMRSSRAQSLAQELSYREQQADAALRQVTRQLSELEGNVGTDLAELRLLNETGSGNGSLREQMLQIKSEHRAALDKQQASDQLLDILTAAQANTSELIATPNQLLEAQPALRRLKDGLIDAQLRSAELQGTRTDTHPSVVAARQSEEEIRLHLHEELTLAVRGLEAERRVIESRVEQLQKLLDDVGTRMTKLASLRASYNNLVAEVKEKNEKLTRIRADLADARSSVAAASTTSLVTKVGATEISDYPVGPSRKVIAAGGFLGGLALGLGILFLTLPPESSAQSANPSEMSPNGYGQAAPAPAGHGLSLKEALRHLAHGTPSRN